MVINGEKVTLNPETTVLELLKERDLRPEIVAVEINEEILPKEQYGTYKLSESDTIEIVQFMGGGAG